MVVGPPSQRPVILAVRRRDRQIIDARDTPTHQPLLIELPVLVAVGAKMLPAIVVPLIGEADRNPITGERPELLDQAVVQLPTPLASEKRHDLGAPLDELGPVSPDAILGVSERDSARIAAVPAVLRRPDLLRGSFGSEGR